MAVTVNEPYKQIKDGLAIAIRKSRSDCIPGETARQLLSYDSPNHTHLVGIDWECRKAVYCQCSKNEVIFIGFDSDGLANGGPTMNLENGLRTWIETMSAYWGWLHPRYR